MNKIANQAVFKKDLIQRHCQTIKLYYNNCQSQAELCLCLATLFELQEQMLEFLHPEEIDYYTTITFEKRQQTYLLGRYAAKQAINNYDNKVACSDILIKAGIFKYPVVYYPSSKRIQVTISHCESMASGLAFPESCPMGIDIERIKPNNKTIIAELLTSNEKRLINSCLYITNITSTILDVNITDDIFYTIFWSIKEAISKVLRTGMMTPFETYAIKNIRSQDNYLLSEFDNFAQYQAMSFLLGEQVCSIVYPKQANLIINIPVIQAWISKT